MCSAFQTAYAHVTVAWSTSGTYKAQEIKAVNKGPTDKGSPDSYESRAGRGLAAGLFRTRVDGHEKTNHSDEHLALPFHTDFHLCSSHHLSPRTLLSFLISSFFFPDNSDILHWIHMPQQSLHEVKPKSIHSGNRKRYLLIWHYTNILSWGKVVWLYCGPYRQGAK